MHMPVVFLLYVITLGACTPQTTSKPTKRGVATITSHAIARQRQSPGSGRLSLINYRFNRRPKKKHLDTVELKMVLGTAYDSKFMSIELPHELNNPDAGASYVIKKDSWRFREMLQELQSNNLTQELQQIAGEKYIIGKEFVNTVEKWLLKRGSCPVKYAWEDIGALFWPRYIRRGECSTDQGTCSWPSGMHCVPSGTTNIEILRWHCRNRKSKGRKKGYKMTTNKDYEEEEKHVHMKCGWIRVPYPITTECMCTC